MATDFYLQNEWDEESPVLHLSSTGISVDIADCRPEKGKKKGVGKYAILQPRGPEESCNVDLAVINLSKQISGFECS